MQKTAKNERTRFALQAILCIIALLVLLANASFLREKPFSFHRSFASPSYVCSSNGEAVIVIENSKTRVRVINASRQLTATIRGGATAEDAFYYAEYAATDGQSIYLADITHKTNSSHVSRERVLRFSMQGVYKETLWDIAYQEGEMPLQLGTIRGLYACDGKVYFLRIDGAATLSLYEGTANGGVRLLRAIDAAQEAVYCAAYDPYTKAVAFTTMQGSLITDTQGIQARLPYGNGENSLRGVAITAGDVFVCDMRMHCILRTNAVEATPVFSDGAQFLSASRDTLAFTDGESVYLSDLSGTQLYQANQAPLSPLYAFRVILAWLSAAFLAFICIKLLIAFFRIAAASRITKQKNGVVAIVLCILLTAAFISYYLIANYQQVLEQRTLDDLKRTAYFLSGTSGDTFGEPFSRLNKLSDYNNDDYRRVRQYLDAYFEECYRNGINAYYILLKFDAQTDFLWGVMDYENTNGVVYPYMPYKGSGYDTVAESGEALLVESEADEFGVWRYVVVPVYDAEKNIIGLLEIGENSYSELLARNELIKGIVSSTLAALLMVLLLLSEIGDFRDNLSARAALRASCAPKALPLGFLRCVIFLVFLGDNFDAAYIPQLSEQLYASSALRMSAGVAAAIPMSVQLLAIAAAALAGGAVLDRRSIKYVMTSSAVIRIAGALLALLSLHFESYLLYAFAKLLGGIGTGGVAVACNAIPSCTADESEQGRLFADLNIGIMAGVVLGASLGGYAAQYFGYTVSYMLSIALMLLCLAAVSAYIGKDWRPLSARVDTSFSLRDALAVLKKPSVYGFLFFLFLPFCVLLYFKDYVLPLFGASLGYSASSIGNIMLLGGAIAIFFGATLPEYFINSIGARKTVVLSNALVIAALLLFCIRESYLTAMLAVCVLGFSSSFGMAAQGVYYTAAVQNEKLGAGAAMGIYGLTDNLSQGLGPLFLGALLRLGFGRAMGIAAGIGAVLLLLFLLLTRKRRYAVLSDTKEVQENES